MRLSIFLFMVMLVAIAVLPACAQISSVRPNFLTIDSAFTGGQYDKVELLVLRELNTDTALIPDETARLCLLAGYSLIMLNRETDARAYFSRALDAVPDLKLDPVQVSPKFRMVFDDVVAHHVAKKEPANGEPAATNSSPQIAADRRSLPHTAVAPRSQLINLVLPGAGQMREGYTIRGAAFLTAQAATLGVFIWRMNELRHSRADYLAEPNNSRIQTTYNKYNRDYRWAWGSGIMAGVVYLAAQADLIRLTPRADHNKPQAALLPVLGSSSPALCVQLSW